MVPMNKLLTIFLLLIFFIALLLVCIAAFWHRHTDGVDIDSQYIDENGDHIYYDRSLIEKKNWAKHDPHGLKYVRKFSRLFKK